MGGFQMEFNSPVKIVKQKGVFRGKKFRYVTVEAGGKIKSHHATKKKAIVAMRARNRALRQSAKRNKEIKR